MSSEIAKKVGKKLRKLREDKGWTQVYAAKIFDITNGALSNYERGSRMPDSSMLKKFAEVYEVTIDFLMEANTKCTKKATKHVNSAKKGLLEEKYPEVHDVEEAMEVILAQPGLMLKGSMLSDESKIILANAIQMGLRTAEELERKKREKEENNQQ